MFIDFNFSWPPNGGADVDTFNILKGLWENSFDIYLVVFADETSTDRGKFDTNQLPFPSQRISIRRGFWKPKYICNEIASIIHQFKPVIIVLQHGFHIKIPIIKFIKTHYPYIPLISRNYAHEIFCLYNPQRFKEGKPCPNNVFENPNLCRKCSLSGLKAEILKCTPSSWTKDYTAVKAFSLSYLRSYHPTLLQSDATIVYNRQQQEELRHYNISTIIIPSGINIKPNHVDSYISKSDEGKRIIFMAGRCDDPTKGLHTLIESGKILYQNRKDFVILATSFNLMNTTQWFKPLGWLKPEEITQQYEKADICVVPSVWEEPFGISALEAMTLGKTVIASNLGGLKEIIRDHETGILFSPGDPIDLARKIDWLLNDENLRKTIGNNAQKFVRENYTWDYIINRYYIPLLEKFLHKEDDK